MRTTETHVFFYGGIFSNWYGCEFTDPITKIVFANTEQAFMWQKAHFFQDIETRNDIMLEDCPKRAKALGREIKHFNELAWTFVRFGMMSYVNYLKFSQNSELNRSLLNTGERVLVEASPVDKIWGVGLAEDDPRIDFPEQWRGKNLLGHSLMAVRMLAIECSQ